MRARAPAVLACMLALILAAQTARAAERIEITPEAFEPADARVAPGEAVTWVNVRAGACELVSAWDEGASFQVRIEPQQSFTWTFTEPGAYPVRCGTTEGVVEVGGARGTPGAAVSAVAGSLVVAAVALRPRTRRASRS